MTVSDAKLNHTIHTGRLLKLAARDALGVGRPRMFPVTEKRNAEGVVTGVYLVSEIPSRIQETYSMSELSQVFR